MSASRPVTLSPVGGGLPPPSTSTLFLQDNIQGGLTRHRPIIIDDEDDIVIVDPPRSVHLHASNQPKAKVTLAASPRRPVVPSAAASSSSSFSSPATDLPFHELLDRGRGCLRRIQCPWRDCDALLCSFNVFKKHLIRHYAHDLAHARRKGGFPHIVCGWHECEQDGLYSTQMLARHVAEVHLASFADAVCPFQGCHYETKSTISMRAHAESTHLKPWTVQRLRPQITPAGVPRRPTKPLPELCTAVDLDRPVRPYMRSTAAPMRRKRSRSGSSSPPALSMQDLRHEIRPEWGDSFQPLAGDAPTFFDHDQASSNIFDGGPEAPKFVTTGRAFALTSGLVPAQRNYAPIGVIVRPRKPRMPMLYTNAAHMLRPVQHGSKGKTVADVREPSQSEIDRAARDFAAKQIKRVIGFDNWRIRAEFLRCGERLTEHPL